VKSLQRFGLAALSGVLLYLSWPDRHLSFLVFISLVPLFIVLRDLSLSSEKRVYGKVFFYSWLAFAIWNGLTGWWISLAHWSGLVAVVFIAASVESLFMVAYVYCRRKLGVRKGNIALVFLWLTHEWILLSWDMEWPWLALGYAFADYPKWIQWYEYTGVFGGSVYIVLVNLLFVFAWAKGGIKKENRKSFLPPLMMILIPMGFSLSLYYSYVPKGKEVEIVVVQPNIEPYEEKFSLSPLTQLELFLSLAEKKIGPETRYVVGPETLIPKGIDELNLEGEGLLMLLKSFQKTYPQLHLVLGANTIRRYPKRMTETARYYEDGGFWYDVYNTAMQVSGADSIPLYHKSKLVVAAEKMPFLQVLEPLLGDIVIDFGGISGSNRTQKNREIFVSDDGEFKIAPIICWENEFGSFQGEYFRKGAQLIFLITNDGWWGDSEGHRQHLHYTRVRAIESRKAVARSANTGISAFINQRGDIEQQLAWEERGSLKQKLAANPEITFYSKHGDYLLRIAVWLSVFFLLYALVRRR